MESFDKNYVNIIYFIFEGDVPSVQCKMSLNPFESVKATDALSPVFNNFNIPVLTSRFHRSKAALKFLRAYV
jgi:hypothetical protein